VNSRLHRNLQICFLNYVLKIAKTRLNCNAILAHVDRHTNSQLRGLTFWNP
jgi:hypothetical protein